jgi:hypothetical protein
MKRFINIITNTIKPIELNIENYNELILLLNYICDKRDFTKITLKYGGNKINLAKDNKNITLKIDIYNCTDIHKLMNNLPINIDELVIKLESSIFFDKFDNLEKSFLNLPFTLNKIQFIYPSIYKQYLSKKYKCFNIFFNIKIPLNCKIFVYFGDFDNYVENCCYNITIINTSMIELKNKNEIYTINYVLENEQKGGGGLMQLVAYGTQDVYLTSNPQIHF